MGTDLELAGQTLAERYDVLQLLGTGGMGAVYRAHDRELDELVALKVIRAEIATNPGMSERFRHEVKLARRVTHTNVARTFELVHATGLMFCTMELVDGESLRDRLERGDTFTIDEATAIAGAVCAGLAAAHVVGVIHRDIKPANILLANDGRVVVADFGVAAFTVSAANEISGTPAYMAPEQARGEPPTPATDVYAVGVVLYEMLSGRRAFPGDTQHVLATKQQATGLQLDGVPAELAWVIARATAPDRIDRLTSVDELGGLLAPWATETTTVVGPKPRGRAQGLHDVVVVTPSGDGAGLHIAGGVYEALLDRLSRLPRVRVQPRITAASSERATVIELVAATALGVTLRRGPSTSSFELPLSIAEIELAADAIAGATAELLDRAPPDARSIDARDLMLQARLVVRGGLHALAPSVELLDRARALAPEDPAIAAAHALASIRLAVMAPTDLASAVALVRMALAIAPGVAASHVAAGHLELHTGEASHAATHYRTAIACSRYDTDGHESLGRMLLEAGFLDAGMARIDDALAIAPSLAMVKWDIARAYALEQRWEESDRMAAHAAQHGDYPIVARLRLAWWRRDRAAVVALRANRGTHRVFEPRLLDLLLEIAIDDTYARHRAELLTIVERTIAPVRRRRALIAQLVAEAACASGDVDTGIALVEQAVELGLFDLHWLDKCPVLEEARRTGRLVGARARVNRRAEAILDALYGDHEPGQLSETMSY